jgi:hypothetical protein
MRLVAWTGIAAVNIAHAWGAAGREDEAERYGGAAHGAR